MNVLLINGPNLHLLGQREPDVYGGETLEAIERRVSEAAASMGVDLDCFQSNEEGTLVTKIGEAGGVYDGLILNPAAYTHTSIALRDAIKACGVPCVEVHLSNTHARETFRHTSLTAPVCIGQVMGFGGSGYVMALQGLVAYVQGEAS